MSKSALVFGASGVTGWSFVNEILNDYPKPGIWSKVHALTNRPLSQEQSQWPNDPRLNIVSGIDLLKGTQEELENEMKQKIKGIEDVTHVYYLAYKAGTDVQKELEEAVAMFKRSTIATDYLSKKLEFVVLQTGAKMCKLFLSTTVQLNGGWTDIGSQMDAISSKITRQTTFTSHTRNPSPASNNHITTYSSITHNWIG